jgi:hypothetical protein
MSTRLVVTQVWTWEEEFEADFINVGEETDRLLEEDPDTVDTQVESWRS